MSSSEDRKTLKSAREMVQGAQKWLRINRDLLAPAQILAITTKIGELEQALKTGNAKTVASRSDELEQKIRGALPAQKSPAAFAKPISALPARSVTSYREPNATFT